MAAKLTEETKTFYGPYVWGTGIGDTSTNNEILFATKGESMTYLDAYEGGEKRTAALRVIEDGIKNRSFALKAYTQLDFTEAVSYLLLELVNKEDK